MMVNVEHGGEKVGHWSDAALVVQLTMEEPPSAFGVATFLIASEATIV